MSKIVVQKGKEKRLVTICEIKDYRHCVSIFSTLFPLYCC